MEKTILLLGGDRRQTWLVRQMEELGRVRTLNVPALPDTACPGACDLVILPCPCLTPEGRLRGAGEGLPLSALDPFLGPETRVFGGATGLLKASLERRCASVTDLLEDSAVTEENACLTAEAAFILAERHTEASLFGRRVAVLGFGRIGSRLARLLSAHGAQVTVAARKPAARRSAGDLGCGACAFEDLPAGQELVFNTVPVRTLTDAQLEDLGDCLWVELASAPGGLPDPPPEGLRLLPAGGLPGRILPRSAAEVLYGGILRALGLHQRRGEKD